MTFYIRGPLRQTKPMSSHAPRAPVARTSEAGCSLQVREQRARHPALPMIGRGVGASEDQQFVLPHGTPHSGISAAAMQQVGVFQRELGIKNTGDFKPPVFLCGSVRERIIPSSRLQPGAPWARW